MRLIHEDSIRRSGGSTRAGSYSKGVNVPRTEGGPRISRLGTLGPRGFSRRESAAPPLGAGVSARSASDGALPDSRWLAARARGSGRGRKRGGGGSRIPVSKPSMLLTSKKKRTAVVQIIMLT